jgi:hypothetical protein
MARANQPYNYDEDLSASSQESCGRTNKNQVSYLSTNLLTPGLKLISHIEVGDHNEEKIQELLKDYFKKAKVKNSESRIFDPKDSLNKFKNGRLPDSLLRVTEVKNAALDAVRLQK